MLQIGVNSSMDLNRVLASQQLRLGARWYTLVRIIFPRSTPTGISHYQLSLNISNQIHQILKLILVAQPNIEDRCWWWWWWCCCIGGGTGSDGNGACCCTLLLVLWLLPMSGVVQRQQ